MRSLEPTVTNIETRYFPTSAGGVRETQVKASAEDELSEKSCVG